jgi:hypothetical protein
MVSFNKRSLVYLKLFISINKNMFFDRFSFLRSWFSSKAQTVVYVTYYIITNYLFKYLFIFLLPVFGISKSISALIVYLGFLFLFVKTDSTNWKLYFRSDICLAEPEQFSRFRWIFTANIIFDLLIQDNIILDIIVLGILLRLSILKIAVLLAFIVALYSLILLTYFILYISGITIKKIYSVFSYIFSMVVTTAVIYYLIVFIIDIIKFVASKGREANVFYYILDAFISLSDGLWNMYDSVSLYCAGSCIVLAAVLFILVSKKLIRGIPNFIPESNTCRYYLMDAVCTLFGKFLHPKKDLFKSAALIKKDKKQITAMYNYLYNKYLYIYLLDRPALLLFITFLLLRNFPSDTAFYLLFPVSAFVMFLDAGSVINKKLVFIFSLCCDYSTLLLLNSSGNDISLLLKSKLFLYYQSKSLSLILYVIMLSLFSFLLGAPPAAAVLLVINVVLWFIISPYMLITNNLIFTRSNYKDYEKYLDEYNIIEEGVSDFMPISVLTNIMGIAIFACAVVVYAFHLSTVVTILGTLAIMAVLFVSTLICSKIMKKIRINIIASITKGEYGADFKKIFANN